MNKDFQNFLSTRPKKSWECDHDEDHWCQNCINTGVDVDLRSLGLGQGTIFTNKQ